jgi:hypothetical protein
MTGVPASGSPLRRILVAAGVGLAAFLASVVLDGPLQISLADQLILTAMAGSVALIGQILADFHGSLQELVAESRTSTTALADDVKGSLDRLRAEVARDLVDVSNASQFLRVSQTSALRPELLFGLLDTAGELTAQDDPILRDLAEQELVRTTGFLHALRERREITYEGEDRDWLLGLTGTVRASLDAVSLHTADDARRRDWDITFWTSDLGLRYLDLQRSAVLRGVAVRRIFVVDDAAVLGTEPFRRVVREQLAAGVRVRYVDVSTAASHLATDLRDVVIFDRAIWYQVFAEAATSPSRGAVPAVTRMILDPDRVSEHARRYDRAWELAAPIKGFAGGERDSEIV